MKYKYIVLPLFTALLWHLPAGAMVAAEEVAERRRAVAGFMGENALLVMFPAVARRRSNDIDWPYRQSNHLYYLTNHTLPGTHLVLVKEGRELREYLFAKLSDPQYEVWQGQLPDLEDLRKTTAIETIYSEDIFAKSLTRLLNGQRINPDKETRTETPEHFNLFQDLIAGQVEIWLDLGRYRQLDAATAPSRAQRLAQQLRARFPEITIHNISPRLETLRRTKSARELELLQRAIDTTGEAQRAAMLRAPSARYEYQVQASIEYTFRELGACCSAFPSIVAGGRNGTILHYVENNAALSREDLLLVDVGAEVDYYSADITRTFPVSGKFSRPQRAIYQLVLDAQTAAIAAARRGITMNALKRVAMRTMGPGLVALGLVAEDNDEQVESYFLHSLGHSLGLDTHDAFEYHLTLDEGMVITIEPGLYVRGDDVKEKDWYTALSAERQRKIAAALDIYDGIGVRIEDVVHITRGGAKTLSGDIPARPEDIETFMAGAVSEP